MGVWDFGNHNHLRDVAEIVVGFDYTMGWFAGLLAVFAGFALFPTLARVRSARTPGSRSAWLLGGATVMGFGFWGATPWRCWALSLDKYFHN